MSEIILMIRPKDVIERTVFNGNIDGDSLMPLILIAQTTNLKSFLGKKLYDKLYNDFVANSLSGVYLEIYEEYVKDILAYNTAALFIDFGSYKVSENGVYRVTGENMNPTDESDTTRLVLRYNTLTANAESNFKEFVQGLNLPELQTKSINVNTQHPWL